jgi:hypothetical protein
MFRKFIVMTVLFALKIMGETSMLREFSYTSEADKLPL